MTGRMQNENIEKRFENWLEPEEKTNKMEKRKMLGEAMKIAIRFIMKNHIYEFDNHMYKQAKGGPIGLEITGDIANIFMVWWDKQLLTKIREHEMKILLYKRYIDDINLALTTPNNTYKKQF